MNIEYAQTIPKRKNPLHIVSMASSGTGKSHLQESVAALIPDEDKIGLTALSDNAFYYFNQRELCHKLVLIEDLDGAENVLYTVRELQTKGYITKAVTQKDSRGNMIVVHHRVDGPVCVAGCTTKEYIYEDNANRSFLIYLDGSAEQDERIMAYQRAVSAGRIDHHAVHQVRQLLQNTQRILSPVTVRNPYAEQLKLPSEVFKPRRTNSHYLLFIEAITFYHQFQREHKVDHETGEIYIETTLEDIAAANNLIKEILLHKSDELNSATRQYLENLKLWLSTANKTAFTTREVRKALRMSHSSQKRYMLQLLHNNYIKKSTGSKSKGYLYEIVSYDEYERLQNSVSSVLNQIISFVEMNSSGVVQNAGEPLEATPAKENGKKFKSSVKKAGSTKK